MVYRANKLWFREHRSWKMSVGSEGKDWMRDGFMEEVAPVESWTMDRIAIANDR